VLTVNFSSRRVERAAPAAGARAGSDFFERFRRNKLRRKMFRPKIGSQRLGSPESLTGVA
jgi:hypothetical protein